MEKWQEILQKNTLTPDEIREQAKLTHEQYEQIAASFPIRIIRTLLSDGAWPCREIAAQFLPDIRELENSGRTDPLEEEMHRPAALIVHRYPNRVLFLVSNVCASYCRFCTRRRMVGKPPFPSAAQLTEGLRYIANHPHISEVILSGGDPLLLTDMQLKHLLEGIRGISHVRVIRVATRTLFLLPERITPSLVQMLVRHQPVYVVAQFNHPAEFTAKSDRAIARLVDHGIPVLNQSVLLKGVNDNPVLMLDLVQRMVERRIRPYYLHQLDPVRGATHFAVPTGRGKEIIDYLRKNIGGYAVPHYVFDDPREPAKKLLYP